MTSLHPRIPSLYLYFQKVETPFYLFQKGGNSIQSFKKLETPFDLIQKGGNCILSVPKRWKLHSICSKKVETAFCSKKVETPCNLFQKGGNSMQSVPKRWKLHSICSKKVETPFNLFQKGGNSIPSVPKRWKLHSICSKKVEIPFYLFQLYLPSLPEGSPSAKSSTCCVSMCTAGSRSTAQEDVSITGTTSEARWSHPSEKYLIVMLVRHICHTQISRFYLFFFQCNCLMH